MTDVKKALCIVLMYQSKSDNLICVCLNMHTFDVKTEQVDGWVSDG